MKIGLDSYYQLSSPILYMQYTQKRIKLQIAVYCVIFRSPRQAFCHPGSFFPADKECQGPAPLIERHTDPHSPKAHIQGVSEQK